MMRQGARAKYREREGDKEISKYTPLLLLKGGKSRELSKGGGQYKDPPSKCKKSTLHNSSSIFNIFGLFT